MYHVPVRNTGVYLRRKDGQYVREVADIVVRHVKSVFRHVDIELALVT